MGFRRLRSLILLAAYLPACTSYQATTTPLPELLASPKPPTKIQVATTQGNNIQFAGPHIVGDTLFGDGKSLFTNLPVTGLPLDQVRRVEVKRFDTGKTVALVVVTAGAVVLISVMAGDAVDDIGTGMSF